MRLIYLAVLVPLAFLPAAESGQDQKEEGFLPMFNGRDLTGWVNVNCAPETFFVKDGMIITTGKPTGYLRTERQYENFIAEFEWMHLPPKPTAVGNSGFFVWADPIPAVGTGYTRGIEVQVLVNLETKDQYTSHGDIFSIWGAKCTPDRPHPKGWERCLPSENRCKGANEWNHYRIVANDGAIKLSVNGKEVSGVSRCNPRKGYLALEAEGSECRFKNLKIKELPSTGAKVEETADEARGLRSLFTGLDFRGLKTGELNSKHWKARDGVLAYDGKFTGKEQHLWTAEEFGDFELVLDWRLTSKSGGASGILLRGTERGAVAISTEKTGSGELRGVSEAIDLPPEIRAAARPAMKADKPAGQWNRFHITMKGENVTVRLNDKLIIDNARMPGIARRGTIGLQELSDAVEFRSLFARELGKGE